MKYRFEVVDVDRSDLASGHVLRSRPGFPAFPVRLGSEVFQQILEIGGWSRPVRVWDPLCGSGYLLTTIALLHRSRISALLASDVDPDAVTLAKANLELLTSSGLLRRAGQVGPEAAAAAQRLAASLETGGGNVPSQAVVADAHDAEQVAALAQGPPVDVVLTDIPYGNQTKWSDPESDPDQALVRFVRGLIDHLTPGTVIGVAGPRLHGLGGLPAPRRHLRIGKRSVLLWQVQAAAL